MSHNSIQLEYNHRIATVTLNRPAKKNAFDQAMFDTLEEMTRRLHQKLPRVIIVTGAGVESFSAGFDVNPENPMVKDILNVMETHELEPARKLIAKVRKAVDGFVSLPVPIIAAINGQAYGGGAELAMRCDLRVMDEKATICFSEVRLGLMPDWGGGAALAKLVGSSVASDLVLTARNVTAAEALKLGLVNRVSPSGACRTEAISLANQIAANGPKAVQHALSMMRESRNLSLKDTLALEADKAARLIATGECLFGVTAFLERKKPEFPD